MKHTSGKFDMNTWLKKMMVALLALGIGQAAWADDVPDLQKTLQSAKQGNADAQFNLGLMYDSGRGVRQDYTKAVQWYRKAAEQGNAKAQYNLGLMYANGKGARQNLVIAKEWFGKACDNGLQQSCDDYRTLD